MGRVWALYVGVGAGLLAAAALLLNQFHPRLACRLCLCPESTVLTEARRLSLTGSDGDLSLAAEMYRNLVSCNPASPYRWCDLAEAELAAGNAAEARRCFAQAEKLGPGIPQTLLRVASFHFRLGETEAALRAMSRILAVTPAYDGLLFSYYDRMDADLSTILRFGIPLQPRPAQSYFRHLLRNGAFEQAGPLWNWLGGHGFQDDTLAGAYADTLIAARRAEQAAAVWAAYLGPRAGETPRRNLLYNGGFETEPLPSPFDWQITQVGSVQAARDSEVSHSGRWSLRLRFVGGVNLSYRHVSQLAFVTPARLRFRGFVKTEDLTTDQGIAFRLCDHESPSRLDVRTPQALGTSGWQPLETEFTVPAGTRLLRIEITRNPSQKFDNEIQGTVWIDDINLEAIVSLHK